MSQPSQPASLLNVSVERSDPTFVSRSPGGHEVGPLAKGTTLPCFLPLAETTFYSPFFVQTICLHIPLLEMDTPSCVFRMVPIACMCGLCV